MWCKIGMMPSDNERQKKNGLYFMLMYSPFLCFFEMRRVNNSLHNFRLQDLVKAHPLMLCRQ